jgi:hypothetical protein
MFASHRGSICVGINLRFGPLFCRKDDLPLFRDRSFVRVLYSENSKERTFRFVTLFEESYTLGRALLAWNCRHATNESIIDICGWHSCIQNVFGIGLCRTALAVLPLTGPCSCLYNNKRHTCVICVLYVRRTESVGGKKRRWRIPQKRWVISDKAKRVRGCSVVVV